ncbi:MAG: hypothetical protein ISP01_04970, partial [Methanobrevibacter arboriphilus]
MIKNGDDQIKNIKLRLMFLLVLFVAIGTMTSSVSAATWDIEDGADLSTIQSIINNAGVGDIINFATGGNYNIDGSININKTLTILGNGASITGVQNANTYIFNLATSNASSVFRDISISNFTLNAMSTINIASGAHNITLDNLTLIGASKNNGSGINTRSVMGLTINNVDVSNFRDAVGVGGGNNTVITNSNFHDLGRNVMSFFQNADNITVDNNIFNNAQYGVFYGGGVKNVVISNNNITDMNRIALALVKAAESTKIINNSITDSNIGIVIKAGDTNHGAPTRINDILIDGNNITNNFLMGILLENIPESNIAKEINITDSNNITGNGKGYQEYMNWTGDEWNNEINTSFNIVKNYYIEDTPVTSPLLTITDTISTNVVKNGGKLIYTLTVKNIGNGTSDAITIDTGFLSSIANSVVTYKSIGAFSNNKWTINSLNTGDTASLVLEVQTKKSGTQNIISTLKTSTQNDTSTNPIKLTVNKDIKVSSSNAFSANKVKRNKYFYITTTIKNTGLDNSSTFNSKIATTKGLKVAAVSKSSYA